MIEVTECPICGEPLEQNARQFLSKPIFVGSIDELSFQMSGFVTYAKCSGCGTFAQSPRMVDEDIERYYRSGKYRQWLNIDQKALDKDEDLRALCDAEILRKLIGEVESHLDIGASQGFFLERMAAKKQSGVELYNHLSKGKYPVNQEFELVSAIHVLEHVPYPVEFLKNIASYSKKYLVIEVPSDESKGGWGRLAHLFHFPSDVFFLLAGKIHFKIIAILHTPHTMVIMERQQDA